MDETLTTYLATLADLLAQADTLAAPYDVQIHALTIAKADALASLTWEIDNLKAIIRPLVLAQHHTVKTDTVTVSYVHKETWDDQQLRTFALESPAILQCLQDSSYVTFRYRPRPT
jgi:hypothetical protein